MPEVTNLPKSLHTVRVLVILAGEILESLSLSNEEAIEAAADRLGYENVPDNYGLKAKALAQFVRSHPAARRAA